MIGRGHLQRSQNNTVCQLKHEQVLPQLYFL